MSISLKSKLGAVGLGSTASITSATYGVYEKWIKDDLILRKDSDYSDWQKASYRYLSILMMNEDLSEDLKLSGVSSLTKLGSSKEISNFEAACLDLLKVDLEENLKKITKWCIKFVSVGDKLQEEGRSLVVDADDARWNGKYEQLIATSEDLKTFLESIKKEQPRLDTDNKDAQRTAIFWCSTFLTNRKYSETAYRKFQERCIVD